MSQVSAGRIDRLGTGLPIRSAVSDGGDDTYTASGLTVSRRCTHLRAMVGDSGIVISLDGGTTDHLTVLPNTVDEWNLSIQEDSDIQVKRYTAGTAFDNCVLEVW